MQCDIEPCHISFKTTVPVIIENLIAVQPHSCTIIITHPELTYFLRVSIHSKKCIADTEISIVAVISHINIWIARIIASPCFTSHHITLIWVNGAFIYAEVVCCQILPKIARGILMKAVEQPTADKFSLPAM